MSGAWPRAQPQAGDGWRPPSVGAGDAGPAATARLRPLRVRRRLAPCEAFAKYADVELHCSRRIPEDRKEPFEVIWSRWERCPRFSRSSILAVRPNCTVGLTSTQWILHVAQKNCARCSTQDVCPEVFTPRSSPGFFSHFFFLLPPTPTRRCLVEPSRSVFEFFFSLDVEAKKTKRNDD